MRLYWSGSALVLALVLAAACGHKEQANSAAQPAAEEGAPAAQPAAAPVATIPDPCKLLTADDVKGAVGGKAVTGPTLNKTNETVCEFKVGEGDVLNITAKVTAPQETFDAAVAAMTERKIAVSPRTGPAASFFASPGYGMVQLNTFDKGKWVIITTWMPSMTEPKQKEMLQGLMSKALERL